MTLPSTRDWIFSAKTFLAAMVALYISLKLQLPRPYWAMASVYIVSNPFVGATTSKARYRAFGTFVGAAAAVLLVPPLVQTPYLLCFAIATLMGVMLYVAISDRTAKSYVFLLAGYTMPLIAFPTVFNPGTIFDVALARTEEITVGIVVASIVNTIILPSKLAPVLSQRTLAWFGDAAFYATRVLAGDRPDKQMSDCWQRLAGTINAYELLLSQLTDDGTRPDVVEHARGLRGRMIVMLPIISAIADPLRTFFGSRAPAEAALAAVSARIATWIDVTRKHPASSIESEIRKTAIELRLELARLEPPRDTLRLWHDAVLSAVLWRMKQLVDLWEDCITLQHAISVDQTGSWKAKFEHWRLGAVNQFFDRGIMLFSTLSAVGGVFLACALWIESDWVDGAAGVSLAAVACCFFAALDDPAPQVLRFFIASSIAVAISGVYLFLVLPNVQDFPLLVIVFSVPFIAVGTLMPNPRFSLMATLVALTTATFLSLQSAYDANFDTFSNSNLSGQIGLLFAYLWTRTTRPFGAELAARRMTHSSWEDLVVAASPHPIEAQRDMAARMLDRLMQLLPRVGSTDDPGRSSVESFRDVRAGLNTLDLQVEREKVGPLLQAAIESVLVGVREHFQDCVDAGSRREPSVTLLHAIDAAFEQTSHAVLAGAPVAAMHALILLRMALFPDTPPPAHLVQAGTP
jgi:uncharacterized membrane protein YccC